MKIRHKLLGLLVFVSLSAQADNGGEPPGGSQWGFGLASYTLDATAAHKERISDSAFALNLFIEGYKNYLSFGAGLSLLGLEDKDEFSVLVEDYKGDVSSAKSHASAYGFFGEAGTGYSLNDRARVNLLAGLEFISADRSVNNCKDCPSENIRIDGGFYLKPGISFDINEDYSLGVNYKYYLTADIKHALTVQFGIKH